MKVKIERDLIKKLQGSLGYGNPETNEIFIDANITAEEQRFVVIHEVLELWLKKRVRHSNIDKIVIDIIDCLQQLGELE